MKKGPFKMNPTLNMVKGSPADFKLGKLFGGALNILGLGKKKSTPRPVPDQGLSGGSRYYTPTSFGEKGAKKVNQGFFAAQALGGANKVMNVGGGGFSGGIGGAMAAAALSPRKMLGIGGGKFATGKRKRRGMFGGAIGGVGSKLFS
tara:strand:- start:109 stop:549 length:441 start_codon:yes stop_codon:yes gene_type:complete